MRSELLEHAREYGTTARDYGASAINTIETQAGKIPTEAYLIGAFASIGISLTLKLLGRDRDAEFVGHWAPTFLTLGLLSKLLEHTRETHETAAAARRGGNRRGRAQA
jgi:hypothetical protein